MRYRIKDYTAYVGMGIAVSPDGGLGDLGDAYFPIHIIADCHKDISQLTEKQLKESILLVYNETTGTLYTSTKNKGKIQGVSVKDGTKINMWFKSTDIDTMPNSEFTGSIHQQNITDELRVEIDLGDDLSSVESKVEEEADSIEAKIDESVNALSTKIDNIDLSAIESKVDKGVNTLSSKIDNIDLSAVAKQGDNQEATNSAILDELLKLNGTYAEQIHNIIGY